jgi:hypothetical protein
VRLAGARRELNVFQLMEMRTIIGWSARICFRGRDWIDVLHHRTTGEPRHTVFRWLYRRRSQQDSNLQPTE